MFMRLFMSDDKFSQMLMQLESQHEYGGGSESGGCEDDEPGDDEDGDEDEEDEDDSSLVTCRPGKPSTVALNCLTETMWARQCRPGMSTGNVAREATSSLTGQGEQRGLGITRPEEEKAKKHEKVFNWETAKYGKIWYDKDVFDLRSVKTEFPAIVFNDNLTSNKTPSCKPTISSINNNEIDFRISFDESDDVDYTIVFDKNSFSYKIISMNDLKTDSKNDNEKVNKHLFPSPEPSVNCIDDLDFFKDFENEFSAIVYSDALTSKLDFSIEPTLCSQHIDEFDFKDETSLSEYDEVEQHILYYNDPFPFNIIYPDDLKSDKGDDDNEIDMIQSSGGKLVFRNEYGVLDIALPPRDQRHQYLRYEGLLYTDANIADFKMRLARIYKREVHRVQGQSVFTSRAWRRLFDIRGPLVHELILEFFNMFRFGEALLDLDMVGALQFQLGRVRRRMSWREFILALGLHSAEEMQTAGFGLYWVERARRITDKGDMSAYWTRILSLGDFLGMDVGSVNVIYLLARYLRLFDSGRKQGAMISRGQFVARLAEHFDMAELVRLQICVELDDTLDWVVPPLPRTQGEGIARLEEKVHERAEVYYECIEPFKSLMCLWVRNKSIVAILLEKVVTPLIETAIKIEFRRISLTGFRSCTSVTMEILLEPTSNKLLVGDVGDSIWIELVTLDINLGPE
nr:hypothetical protein [Tanacetum cinerariifolium]